MKTTLFRPLAVVLGVMLIVSCGDSTQAPGEAPGPTATATIFPAPTAIPTVVAPTPTPTAISTDAPTPTPSALISGELDPAEADLQLPDGFAAEVWLEGPRTLAAFAFDDRGRLYITTQSGQLIRVNDAATGHPPVDTVVITRGIRLPLGLAFHDGVLYVSSQGDLVGLTDEDGDGELDSGEPLVQNLPTGQHQNNGPAIGPDGKIYLPVGSTCDACVEQSERSATVMRFNLDGSEGEVYARGLRNVYQLAFHPEDGTLWGADNGRDDQGFDVPEELNLIEEGGVYGWPDCWGVSGGSNCEGTVAPIAEMESRSSSDGIVFYNGQQFPEEYRNNLFITLWGSSVEGSIGKKVVRVELTKSEGNYTVRVSDFATGFDRPLAIIVAPDGALLVGDHGTGLIYRITYVGP